MRKFSFCKVFYVLAFSLFMILFGEFCEVNATTYNYQSGKVEEKHKDVVVNEFSYDYTTSFENKNLIADGVDISGETFYSGRSITVYIDEYSHWWPFTKDNDSTYIYQYNYDDKTFADSIKISNNEQSSFVLNNEGIYKVVYYFEGEEIFANYINIVLDFHEALVKGDSKYKEVSAFATFSFDLHLKDAYDLRSNAYYYGFANNLSTIDFEELVVFSKEEMEGDSPIYDLDKKLSVSIINDSFVGNNLLYVKVVSPNGYENIFQTEERYEIAGKIQADVYLLNSNGKIIQEKAYYKQGSLINFLVLFNAPVTFNNLQFSVDGANFMAITDSLEKVDKINLQYVVQSGVSYEGIFKLITKNNINAVVNYEGANTSLKVNNNARFAIDVVLPEVAVSGGASSEAKKEYTANVRISEDNLKEVLYYAAKCSMSQNGVCLDSFDDEHPYVTSLGNSKGANIKIDERFGFFNNSDVVLFVKVIDLAGNEKVLLKNGFLMDNVIIPKNMKDEVLRIEDIVESTKTVGKKFVVKVPKEYKITSVGYRFEGSSSEQCVANGEVSGYIDYNCFQVSNYDFNSNVLVELADYYGNNESYELNFRYSTLIDGLTIIGGKNFNVYSNLGYELEHIIYNYMRKESSAVVFNQEILLGINEKLNLDKIPSMENLTISLVYFEGDKIHTIKNNVNFTLSVPSVQELLKTIGSLEAFKLCAIDKCDVDLYLKYDYRTNGVPQTRLVKLKYIDNSVKYKINEFEVNRTFSVDSKYKEFEYAYLNNLNVGIDSDKVKVTKEIKFEDKNGYLKEVDFIDTSVLGKYYITESFEYETSFSFPLNYEVEICDLDAPVVRLNGSKEIILEVGSSFVDPFAVATDNYDSKLVVQSKFDKELDTTKIGTYIISYWCVDSSGNVSEVVTRKIIVKEKSNTKEYLIAGGIGLFTVVIMVVSTVIEVKKEKRKNERGN